MNSRRNQNRSGPAFWLLGVTVFSLFFVFVWPTVHVDAAWPDPGEFIPQQPTATVTRQASPTPTRTKRPQNMPTNTPVRAATSTPVQVAEGDPNAPVATATPVIERIEDIASVDSLEPVRPVKDPSSYDAYITTATKPGQQYHYSCELDASWVILKTYGIDMSVDDQLAILGVDTTIEPSYATTPDGITEIMGGDILQHYSGDIATNFLGRSSGKAMTNLFKHFNFGVTPVHDRAAVEAALKAGQLIWIKTTVDFKRWTAATWITPDGTRIKTVLGNDHAVVVAGYNADVVVIRDVLGPTSTNGARPYEYEVPWPTFLAAWGAQDRDGLAIARTQ